MDGFRFGRVSAVNYAAGTARILYKDKSEQVTKELPLFSQEYLMPEVDDLVLVGHLPNGPEAAVVLGRVWSDQNKPPEGKRGLYRKDLSRTAGKAMLRYAEDENKADVVMPNLRVQTTVLEMNAERVAGEGRSVGFVGNQVHLEGGASITVTGGATTLSGSTVSITGGTVQISGAGDVVLDGISLKNHTHTCRDGETSPAR